MENTLFKYAYNGRNTILNKDFLPVILVKIKKSNDLVLEITEVKYCTPNTIGCQALYIKRETERTKNNLGWLKQKW